MSATRPIQLRLRRDDGDDSLEVRPVAARATAFGQAPTTALDVIREARRSVLITFGPCCASSEPLIQAWARRIAETRPMPMPARLLLLRELAAFFG